MSEYSSDLKVWVKLMSTVSLLWEIYPVIYGIYIILRGELIDKYPYPFFDVNVIGYPKALFNGLVILLVILGIGYFVRATVNLSSRLQR